MEAAWEMAEQPWFISNRKKEVLGIGERKALFLLLFQPISKCGLASSTST